MYFSISCGFTYVDHLEQYRSAIGSASTIELQAVVRPMRHTLFGFPRDCRFTMQHILHIYAISEYFSELIDTNTSEYGLIGFPINRRYLLHSSRQQK